MKRMLRLKLSDGRDLIKIYLMSDIEGDKGGKVIDYEYTNTRGVLRWMPPGAGTYSLVNELKPEYNKMNYKVESDTGFGEPYVE